MMMTIAFVGNPVGVDRGRNCEEAAIVAMRMSLCRANDDEPEFLGAKVSG